MKKSFIIGQISDIHFVNKNEKLFDKFDTYTRFLKTIKTCNELQEIPDFYIISGDLIHDNESFYKEFFQLCNNLKRPVYTMMGNHDKRNALKKYVKSDFPCIRVYTGSRKAFSIPAIVSERSFLIIISSIDNGFEFL